MAPLIETIQEVQRRIAQSRTKGLNEQNAKATLIDPVLRALGWDLENPDDVPPGQLRQRPPFPSEASSDKYCMLGADLIDR